jgi:hypothetical protein
MKHTDTGEHIENKPIHPHEGHVQTHGARHGRKVVTRDDEDEMNSGLDDTMGSSTGEAERAVEAGGWAGTDDATSTAPSDEIGNPPIPEEEKPFHTITRDFEESIQNDEERQEEAAEDSEEASQMLIAREKANAAKQDFNRRG